MTTEQKFTIRKDIALKYLSIYVDNNEEEWLRALGSLSNKFRDKEMIRQSIAATILLPARDKSVIPEVPYNLLFWIHKYTQFDQRDWVKDLEKVIKADEAMVALRGSLTMLGKVDPIEYAPYPRQALRWLVEASKEHGDYSAKTLDSMKFLVYIYGGVIISNIFNNEKNKISKLTNLRNHYFFEKLIHSSYDIDQMVKIKKSEILRTNKSLVNKFI